MILHWIQSFHRLESTGAFQRCFTEILWLWLPHFLSFLIKLLYEYAYDDFVRGKPELKVLFQKFKFLTILRAANRVLIQRQ